jgi:hypothetical protein
MEEISDQYTPADVEDAAAEHWEEVDAYEATKEAHADDPAFFFVDGPPYTSGQMHLGTAWNKALKDALIRYKRMTGHRVTDRPGYDMHGLPIEVKVEEELGFDSKKDIEELGVEEFIEECKTFAERNREKMDEDFQSMGVWMDWDDPYRTVDPSYMEATWWAFQRVHENGLVERGKRAVNQCPRCETALANNEVEYHEIESPSIYVTFPLRDREGSLVIWTTTPWTIPGNTFVAVGEDVTYQAVRAEDETGESELLYLAEGCVEDVLKRGRYVDYEVVDELSAGSTTTRSTSRCPTTPPARGRCRCTPPTTSRSTAPASSTPRPATVRRTSSAGRSWDWRCSLPSRATGSTPRPPATTPASSSATPTTTSSPTSTTRGTCWPRGPLATTTASAGGVTRTSSTSPRTSGSSRSRISKTNCWTTSRRAGGTPSGPGTTASGTSSRTRRTGTSPGSATGGSRFPSGYRSTPATT